ncbi:21363_t:CDS:2, partial [Dentiscutata erythropus]
QVQESCTVAIGKFKPWWQVQVETNRIRVENGGNKLPGDVEENCGNSGHLACLCPFMKDQDHDLSLNNKLIKLCYVDDEFAETLIRVSLNINKISVKYAKRVRFIWKRLNKRNNSHIDDGCIGFIHSVEVVINDMKFFQKFYVIKDLSVDVVFGMLWFVAFRYRCESMKNSDNNIDFVRIENRNVEDPKGQEREFNDVVDVRCIDFNKSNQANEIKIEYKSVVFDDDKTKSKINRSYEDM